MLSIFYIFAELKLKMGMQVIGLYPVEIQGWLTYDHSATAGLLINSFRNHLAFLLCTYYIDNLRGLQFYRPFSSACIAFENLYVCRTECVENVDADQISVTLLRSKAGLTVIIPHGYEALPWIPNPSTGAFFTFLHDLVVSKGFGKARRNWKV